MANQHPTERLNHQLAGGKLANYLTLSIVAVAVLAVACATSTSQQHLSRSASLREPRLALSGLRSLNSISEPQLEQSQFFYSDVDQPEVDRADEDDVPRQLKQAMLELDEERKGREQAAFNQGPADDQLIEFAADRSQPLYSFDGPSDSLASDQGSRFEEPASQSSWPTFDEPGPLASRPTAEAALASGRSVGRFLDALVDELRKERARDQQQQQDEPSAETKYDQLFQNLLADHAQANSLANSPPPGANQKRDEPAKTEAGVETEQRPPAPYTTLLEDEEVLAGGSKQQDRAEVTTRAPETSAAPTTTATYGTLVYDQAAQRPAVTNATKQEGGSIFGRLYSSVAHYLPFLSQLTNLRRGGANSTAHSSGPTAAPANLKQDELGGSEREEGGQQSVGNKLHASTNASVSTALDKSAETKETRENDGERGSGQKQRTGNDAAAAAAAAEAKQADQDNQQSQKNDKPRSGVKVTGEATKINNADGDGNMVDEDFSGQFVNIAPEAKVQPESKSAGLKRDQISTFVGPSPNSNADLDVDMSQMAPVAVGFEPESKQAFASQQQANGYSMLRHSNLVLPFGPSSDALPGDLSLGGKKQDSEGMLGKYIYAPTQHYYLNSMLPSTGPEVGPLNQHHVFPGKHIRPGDEVYGPYGDMPMKAAYAYQKERNTIGDKSNDLYFLIMVGAFCVMAMSVVLAAGLFAYRVQQQRKSSQETEYPTYGVVGPNNMSAKCGAASFVGGYFTGPPSGSSKSGSAKHLPDLYGIPNGTGGSDSGLNSLDKSSSNKKASSVSSLNDHHQSTSSRAGSSNFMAAASQDAARMYHYQHQKQQMIISDRNSGGRQTSASDLDSEDENDDGSYTVYECPGLASAHEMEIKNPLFNDDQSP